MTQAGWDKVRPYGPGKYDTMLDAYVHALTLDGGLDDETTDSRGGYGATWYGVMRFSGSPGGYACADCDITPDEWGILLGQAGVIVSEDNQGFVYVEYFETATELEAAWAHVVETCDEDSDHE